MNDTVIVQIYSGMLASHRATVDDILIERGLREDFLNRCRNLLGDVPEAGILRRLVTLRKSRRLPTLRNADSTKDHN